MLVQYIANEEQNASGSTWYADKRDKTRFLSLTAGKHYVVYGLTFLSKSTEYLICPDGQMPVWASSSLFTLFDAQLPLEWAICLPEFDQAYHALFRDFNIKAIIGYPALVNSLTHYQGLLQGQPEALPLFLEAKKPVDKWWSIRS